MHRPRRVNGKHIGLGNMLIYNHRTGLIVFQVVNLFPEHFGFLKSHIPGGFFHFLPEAADHRSEIPFQYIF